MCLPLFFFILGHPVEQISVVNSHHLPMFSGSDSTGPVEQVHRDAQTILDSGN